MNPIVKFLAAWSYRAFGVEIPDQIWDCSARLRAWLTPLWLPIALVYFVLRIVWSLYAWTMTLILGLWPDEPKWLVGAFSEVHEYSSPIYPWQVIGLAWIGSAIYVVAKLLMGTPLDKLPGPLVAVTVPAVILGAAILLPLAIGNLVGKFWNWRNRQMEQSCHLVNLK